MTTRQGSGGATLRSMLFEPGDSERKMAKNSGSKADALILDRKDAVDASRMEMARGLVIEYLRWRPDRNTQQLWVRINPRATPAAILDLRVVAGRPDGILLPKVHSAADIVQLAHCLDVLEARDGIEPGSIRIIPVATETPQSLFALGSYEGCCLRLAGLTWGAEDIAAAIGASTNRREDGDYDTVFQMACALCLADAAAAELPAIDTIWGDFRDTDGLRRDAVTGRRRGFSGKIAIRPDQVDIINEACTPDPSEIAWARRVVAAFESSPGTGTVGLDGKMLDNATSEASAPGFGEYQGNDMTTLAKHRHPCLRLLTNLLPCVLAFATMAAGTAVNAETWPARPIRLIVPYAAGQGTDVAGRYVAERVAREIGANIVVENRAGAGGNIGSQVAAKAAPDGYTLLMGTNGTHAAAAFLYANPGFDAEADFEPIALTGVLPLVIVTRPDNPVKDVVALIAAARAQPNKINVAVTTTTSRAVFELFKARAEAPLFGVPYKGSAQGITDLIGGQVDYMMDTIASTSAQINGGKLKALAVSSLAGSALLPGIASIAEQGVAGFEIVGWNALYAPKGTPPDIIRRLADATTKVMATPDTKSALLQIGLDPRTLAGPPLTAFLKEEREKWGGVIRAANLKVE